MGIFDRFKSSKKLDKIVNTDNEENTRKKFALSEDNIEDFKIWFNSKVKTRMSSLTEEESSIHCINDVSFYSYSVYAGLLDRNSFNSIKYSKMQTFYSSLIKSAGWRFEYFDGETRLVWNVEDMDTSKHTGLVTAKDMEKYDTRDTKGLCEFLEGYYQKVKSKLSKEQKRNKYFSILTSDIPSKYLHEEDTYSCIKSINHFYLNYLKSKGITISHSYIKVLKEKYEYLDVYYGSLNCDNKEEKCKHE